MVTGVADATIRYCDRLGVEQVARWGAVGPDDLAVAMPIRVPPTFAGQRNYPGLFWSMRSGRHLVYESLLVMWGFAESDYHFSYVARAVGLHCLTGVGSCSANVRVQF